MQRFSDSHGQIQSNPDPGQMLFRKPAPFLPWVQHRLGLGQLLGRLMMVRDNDLASQLLQLLNLHPAGNPAINGDYQRCPLQYPGGHNTPDRLKMQPVTLM